MKQTTAKTAAKKTTAKSVAKKTAKSAAKKTAKSAAKKTAKSAAKKTAKSAAKKTTAKPAARTKAAAKKSPARPRKPAKPAVPTAAPLPDDVRARLQAELTADDLPLEFATAEDAQSGGDALREHYADEHWAMGVLWSDALWAACGEAVAPLELFAELPEVAAGAMGQVKVRPSFYSDAARPDTLWFAPNPEMPAVLFVPVPATREGVRAVLAEYTYDRPQTALRAWMGFGEHLQVPNVYSGELVAVDDHELDRFHVFSPVASTLEKRTYFSGSRFAWEHHANDLYIWDLAYAPCATSPDVVARFSEITGYKFPPDMPVDLVSAIHGFEFATAAEIEARLRAEGPGDHTGAFMLVLGGIGWQRLSTAETLRHVLQGGDPAVDRPRFFVALTYGWERLAWEVALAADDLRAEFAEALADLDLEAPGRLGPCTRGTLRVLPAGADLAALAAVAAAEGWTAVELPDARGASSWQIAWALPGADEANPRRVVWVDVPALELATLVVEDEAALPALAAAFPDGAAVEPLAAPTTAERWRAAAALAWQDPAAPTLAAFLRAQLASGDAMERLVAARLVGLARVDAVRDAVQAAHDGEQDDATRKALAAALAALA